MSISRRKFLPKVFPAVAFSWRRAGIAVSELLLGANTGHLPTAWRTDPNRTLLPFLMRTRTERMRQQRAFFSSRRQDNRYKCQAGRHGQPGNYVSDLAAFANLERSGWL